MKLGICFLVCEQFPMQKIWTAWAEKAKTDDVDVFYAVHLSNATHEVIEQVQTWTIDINAIWVPPQPTSWADISVIHATLRMFDAILVRDVDYIIMFSEKTAPLCSAKQLAKYCKVSLAGKSQLDVYNKVKPSNLFEQFQLNVRIVYSAQFMILNALHYNGCKKRFWDLFHHIKHLPWSHLCTNRELLPPEEWLIASVMFSIPELRGKIQKHCVLKAWFSKDSLGYQSLRATVLDAKKLDREMCQLTLVWKFPDFIPVAACIAIRKVIDDTLIEKVLKKRKII